jgi:hypothetical protein
MSAASRRRGSQVSAGEAAHKMLRRIDKGGNMERTRAVSAWQNAAGEEVARHAMGFAMRGDELIVFTDSAVWASELSALSEHYRAAVNALVGRELVRTMRFTVSKHMSDSRRMQEGGDSPDRTAEGRRIDPVHATAQEAAQIEAMAECIHGEELRAATVRAALRALEWRKGLEKHQKP